MASETIIKDIYNFLISYPPFDLLAEEDLWALSEQVIIQYFEEGERIFSKGEAPLSTFFMVQKGSIDILDPGEAEALLDRCDEGDIFGVRATLGQDTYYADAVAAEESLLYAIPLQPFQQVLEKNPRASLFLASGFASGASILKGDASEPTEAVHNGYIKRFLENTRREDAPNLEIDTIKLDSSKKIVDCTPEHTIRQAAKIMKIFNVGSILVSNAQKHPLGIITDSDFRRKVVSEEAYMKEQAVTAIMSSPVATVKEGLTVGEVMLMMVRRRISHIVVTEDGSEKSLALGIISQRDILIAQGNNPAVLTKQIMKTRDVALLADFRQKAENLVSSYLQQDVGVPFISNIITEINDALIEQAIKISRERLSEEENLEMPDVPYCFLSLGSEGRREQLLRTDQDNALIYADPPEAQAEAVRTYFLKFTKHITDILIACGFVKCPADMMASNPDWCQPVSKWQNYFRQWIRVPDPKSIMNTNIFFDFRPIEGDFQLADDLKKFIFAEIEKNEIFLSFMAKSALQNPPPLSFFRSFIVERSGSHKNEFDIKARAMMPLTDAARVLVYDLRIATYGSTFQRLKEVAKAEPALASLTESAAMAYEILVKQRAIHGLRNKNSGRFINPDDFNKLERQTIRSTFKTIEKVQKMLETRYRLGYMG